MIAARHPFVGLRDQIDLSPSDLARGHAACASIRRRYDEREEYLRANDLDPQVWLPAANWEGDQAFYANARVLMRGERIEYLRLLSQQFTGYALWSMQYAGPLPPHDLDALEAAVARCADRVDAEALERCARYRSELPRHLTIGPPLALGEVGWWMDGGLVNHDTWAYWERLDLLHRAGLLRPGIRVLEIGGGYGGLAWYIHEIAGDVDYTIVDIPESLIYSALYLSILRPASRNRFLANYEFPALAASGERFDVVLNTISLSEMSETQVRTYCDGIAALLRPDGSFFEQNQDHKARGFSNTQELASEYFERRRFLGGPPDLPHGYANVWSAPRRRESPRTPSS